MFTSRSQGYLCTDALAGLMNFIPTDDVYLPIRPYCTEIFDIYLFRMLNEVLNITGNEPPRVS
ncbi:hypothetical protein ECP03022939_1165 [Escherichia coli P0302293.9]|nr:hypothetical protein ECP030230810_4835 [Escherichia coli P0302308.10]END18262.1 hypothetical protein ECP03023083_5036 [Escherichia coli P0302308.3]END18358.1 hypothetical protein ECP03023084_4647 [Escherichia coli P0302308.4]END23096.1 hypothetical protein ECP03023085_1704 [Escherichia coli P0302308.5]ENE37331.1 hypothetical protein ECP03022936_1273 [Escherichia coli P0302293.6]ENE53101.1 hypothetical protein ECP03022939_1165 [Escherichia coli P0302293.9]ENH24238.1 hypothetical protein ECP